MKRARRKIVQKNDGLSPQERVCAVLRDIQWKTNCSTQTLQTVLDSLRDKLGDAVRQCETAGAGLPRDVKSADKKMRGTVCLRCLRVFYQYQFKCVDVQIKIIVNPNYQPGWCTACVPARMCWSRLRSSVARHRTGEYLSQMWYFAL